MLTKLMSLLVSFTKIGLVSLGGGHSMLKLIEHEVVISKGWLAETEFVTMVGSTFLFPGLTAVKLSALIGYQVAGFLGLLVAVIALNLPGLLLCFFGYSLLVKNQSAMADKLVIVVQYGALALLAAASFSIASSVLNNHFSFALLLLSMVFFFLLAVMKLPPFWGLVGFILIGYLALVI